MSSRIVLGYFQYRYIIEFGLNLFDVRCEAVLGSKYEIVCNVRTIRIENKKDIDGFDSNDSENNFIASGCMYHAQCVQIMFGGEGVHILLRFFSFRAHSP